MPKSDQTTTLPPTFEIPNPPKEMDTGNDQNVTAESAITLIMVTTNKPIPEGLVKQRILLDELAQDENIQEGPS